MNDLASRPTRRLETEEVEEAEEADGAGCCPFEKLEGTGIVDARFAVDTIRSSSSRGLRDLAPCKSREAIDASRIFVLVET